MWPLLTPRPTDIDWLALLQMLDVVLSRQFKHLHMMQLAKVHAKLY